MTVTAAGLTRAAAAGAAVAGALFIAVQIGHPGSSEFTTATTQWVVRSAAKSVMAALALAGITGIYLRQRSRVGVLGLIGYLVLAVGYLTMFSSEVIAATVLPGLVDSEPAFVDDVVAAATGGTPAGDIGHLQALFTITGIGYLLGGLLVGVTTYRAGILARWAAALLAVGTVSTAALAVLPEAFNRPMAVPTGLALIGLGVSLWRNPEAGATATPAARALEPAAR
jgi:hypothetical protein